MGLHPVGLQQDRVSEPPAGEHCLSRVRWSRPTLRPCPRRCARRSGWPVGWRAMEHW